MAVGLNVYRLVLRLESPVALPTRRARLGYLGAPNYIPATTLRGALITALYREGMVDENALKSEASYPTMIVSPAYPLADGKESKPAHPFIYQCKQCEDSKPFTTESKVFRGILSSEEIELPSECHHGHRALRMLHPSPVIDNGGGVLEEVGVKVFRYVAVNISRRRAAAVKGVLYSYELIAGPNEFWATIASRRELDLNGLLLLVGRGVSRGLGRVKVEKAQKIDLFSAAQTFANPTERPFLLRAMSPLLGCRGAGLEWMNYPETIDLGGLAGAFNINGRGKMTLEKVYGRTVTFDAGWDMYNTRLRPRFQAKAPGTIVQASMKDVSGDVGLLMAVLRYWGDIILYGGSTPITGVNMLEPVEV